MIAVARAATPRHRYGRSTGGADVAAGTVLVGAGALGFSLLYLVSDLVELGQGGFSTFQLVLTYVAEAAIPLFVLGLHAVQRPWIGRLGLVSALAYAYAFVFFTGTVTYALVDGTADWADLEDAWGPWITVHSLLMVLAGIGFGAAVVRAKVLPRWTGLALVAAMVLLAATAGAPDVVRTAAAGVRDLAFAGMGASLLVSGRRRAPDRQPSDPAAPDSGYPAPSTTVPPVVVSGSSIEDGERGERCPGPR